MFNIFSARAHTFDLQVEAKSEHRRAFGMHEHCQTCAGKKTSQTTVGLASDLQVRNLIKTEVDVGMYSNFDCQVIKKIEARKHIFISKD